jgi:hypothetical protein
MKKNKVSPNQYSLPFTEPEYKPREMPAPLPPIVARNIVVRAKWELTKADDIFPELRFGGKYLEQAGFLIGRAVSLIVRKNKVVLTVSRPDADPEPEVAARLLSIKARRQRACILRQQTQ